MNRTLNNKKNILRINLIYCKKLYMFKLKDVFNKTKFISTGIFILADSSI